MCDTDSKKRISILFCMVRPLENRETGTARSGVYFKRADLIAVRGLNSKWPRLALKAPIL